MLKFKIKKLFERQLSCGETLKQARESKFLSFNKVSKDLGIKKDYLEKMENDQLSQLPHGLYSRQFVLKYATYLDLDQDFFNNSFAQNKVSQYNYFSCEKLSKNRFLSFPRIIRNIAFFLIIAVCLSYFSFYFFSLISPPQLSISYPPSNFVAQESIIELSGETEPEAIITINGESVLNNQGSFSKEVDLKNGINQITIISKQKYSKKKVITRQILLEKQYGKK